MENDDNVVEFLQLHCAVMPKKLNRFARCHGLLSLTAAEGEEHRTKSEAAGAHEERMNSCWTVMKYL